MYFYEAVLSSEYFVSFWIYPWLLKVPNTWWFFLCIYAFILLYVFIKKWTKVLILASFCINFRGNLEWRRKTIECAVSLFFSKHFKNTVHIRSNLQFESTNSHSFVYGRYYLTKFYPMGEYTLEKFKFRKRPCLRWTFFSHLKKGKADAEIMFFIS